MDATAWHTAVPHGHRANLKRRRTKLHKVSEQATAVRAAASQLCRVTGSLSDSSEAPVSQLLVAAQGLERDRARVLIRNAASNLEDRLVGHCWQEPRNLVVLQAANQQMLLLQLFLEDRRGVLRQLL